MRKIAWIAALLLLGSFAIYENGPVTQPGSSVFAAQSTNQQTQSGQQAGSTGQPQLSNDNHYTNSDGRTVHSPAYSRNGVPAGATAQCSDGTYSFSQHKQGACSHHGGVAKWL
jgi:hypothetical protein